MHIQKKNNSILYYVEKVVYCVPNLTVFLIDTRKILVLTQIWSCLCKRSQLNDIREVQVLQPMLSLIVGRLWSKSTSSRQL